MSIVFNSFRQLKCRLNCTSSKFALNLYYSITFRRCRYNLFKPTSETLFFTIFLLNFEYYTTHKL